VPIVLCPVFAGIYQEVHRVSTLGFYISDLIAQEEEFEILSEHGVWVFRKAYNYQDIVAAMDKEGTVGNTFTAHNWDVNHENVFRAIDELIDTCLILSFLTAKCVTPVGATSSSALKFIGDLPDKFIRPRAIYGFPPLQENTDLKALFKDGMKEIRSRMQEGKLRLSLCHWISGLTSLSLEDIFVWATIQMDIVRQCESQRLNCPCLSYYDASEKASKFYGLRQLPKAFKQMRTDLIHEGKLSGTNFPTKSKSDCAAVIAKTLSWIDLYVLKVLKLDKKLKTPKRWTTELLLRGMPSVTLWDSMATPITNHI
jgi:hypothetical protein